MKSNKILIILLLVITFLSCNNKEKKAIKKELTIAEKIANAHGFENWNNVSNIQFTFNVDKDSTHFERSWTWNPKTSDVTLTSNQDTISYNRKNIDSTLINADKGFINDKFWLLAPYQIIWDSDAKLSEPTQEKAPISNTLLNKITLTYPQKGGYTPGDAYDFYYNNNYIIKEWIYRKENNATPSMTTTFENHKTFNGLKIALDHRKKDVNWNLNFTNVKVINK